MKMREKANFTVRELADCLNIDLARHVGQGISVMGLSTCKGMIIDGRK